MEGGTYMSLAVIGGFKAQEKFVYKNLEFQAGEGSCWKEHVMFEWYMTENFSLRVLNIAVLVYGLLMFQWKSGDAAVKRRLQIY